MQCKERVALLEVCMYEGEVYNECNMCTIYLFVTARDTSSGYRESEHEQIRIEPVDSAVRFQGRGEGPDLVQ